MRRLREVFGDLDDYENEFIAYYVYKRYKDPFAVLVATVLSQNTTEKNAFAAWRNLEEALGRVTPEAVLSLGTERLKELIRPAGLQEQKASAIVEAARKWEEVKKAIEKGDKGVLTRIKGIGEKTADVVLMSFGHEEFPVDTHVKRVAKRLGLVDGNAYKEVSSRLKELFKGRTREAHMYLILLGRKYCKAKKPLCSECPLSDLCPKRGVSAR
ncbi:endonuclease III domain-containing protein [Ignicoccus hospitalis]|uniref:HhH-GPD family protein n=1 Tax=Ignicoccus hospitalis (strain KIN4/I / DSM 18386 / JCM 14125) TaxID=453591 RepID=A8AAU4_IGNH4|nr:endonuclease III [Ignicoccus hospitalis]ABU82046.1 HhH-GPD family protein [Ignicoccus hospitalis KIN4/I]HIH91003.1 endonuclease III [Desulfurococcaceae archaeon]